MPEGIPVCILGAGWIDVKVYVPLIRQQTKLRLVAVYDPDCSRAERVAGLCSAVVGVLADCLEPNIRAAIVCSPPSEHAPAIRALLASGKFVLCEKPVFRSCGEIAAVGTSSDLVRLMGSATMRLRTDVRQLLDWIEAGCIGRLRTVRLVWRRHKGVPGPGSWRTRRSDSPGGVLEDLGPHLFDVAAAMMRAAGETQMAPTEVAAQLSCRGGRLESGASWFTDPIREPYDAPDTCHAHLLFGCDVSVEMDVSWVDEDAGDLVQIKATGDCGSVCLDGLLGLSLERRMPNQSCTLERRGAEQRLEFEAGPGMQLAAFRATLDRFAGFCGGSVAALANADDVAVVTHWLELVTRAALRGDPTYEEARFGRPSMEEGTC
jgi:predicted dehydrogenase